MKSKSEPKTKPEKRKEENKDSSKKNQKIFNNNSAKKCIIKRSVNYAIKGK
jgi:hypothetical protein